MKQTTDTICSVTANPLRGGVAESVDMGSERKGGTDGKTAEKGIGIFPWNRFSRRYRLVNRAPFVKMTDGCGGRERTARTVRQGRRPAGRAYRGSYMSRMRDGLWVAEFDGDSVQTVGKTSVERFAQAALPPI
ncbi:hypothetical protein [Burkholderia metallica]|uniref:hypothetical protein n=1 Tax=Burkholderia metallica TaxID=488729 RepID=UPI00157761E2|nr:hypothetical protein [Burkholderia metallica]